MEEILRAVIVDLIPTLAGAVVEAILGQNTSEPDNAFLARNIKDVYDEVGAVDLELREDVHGINGAIQIIGDMLGGLPGPVSPGPGVSLTPVTDQLDVLTRLTDAIARQVGAIPTTPASDIAREVWAFPIALWSSQYDVLDSTMGVVMEELGDDLAVRNAHQGLVFPRNPWFTLVAEDAFEQFIMAGLWDTAAPRPFPAIPNFGTALAGESVLAFLQRTDPTWVWGYGGPWGTDENAGYVWAPYYYGPPPGILGAWFRCNVAEWQLPYVVGRISNAAGQAGIYPGPDGVLLGSPVLLTHSAVVDGPLDGAILQVTTIPSKYGHWQADGHLSYYHIGHYVFSDENGVCDDYRMLAMDQSVLTSHTLAHPASLLVHLAPGVEVTVTPYTLL